MAMMYDDGCAFCNSSFELSFSGAWKTAEDIYEG
jgi:hypothetical protein